LPAAADANIIVLAAPTARCSTVSRKERPLQAGAAVRDRELRRILQQIVIAGLPVIAAGCVEAVIDTDCVRTVDDTFQIVTPADPPLQFLINRCHADADACGELCDEAMARNDVRGTPTRCTVEFGAAGIDISVSYEVFDGGSSCPDVFDPSSLPEGAALESRGAATDEPQACVARAPEVGAALAVIARDEARPAAPSGLPDGPRARGRYARALDSSWNGGRTCHA